MSCKILAIDTATDACSVALWLDGKILQEFQIAPREHAKIILPLIQTLLHKAQLTLPQLTAIAFSRGPGSFTGLRIAAGITQGLAYGASLPVIAVSTLQALAQGAYRECQATQVLAAIDARMQQIYCGSFYNDGNNFPQAQSEECVCDADQIILTKQSWVGAGNAWPTYQTQLADKVTKVIKSYPHAQDVATIAAVKWGRGEIISAEEAIPVYLRDKVTHQ